MPKFSSEDIEYQQAARFMIVSTGRNTDHGTEEQAIDNVCLLQHIMTLTKDEIMNLIRTESRKEFANLLVLSRVDQPAQHLRQLAEQALAVEPQPEPPTAQTRTS